jgi:hypothetical protein
MFTDSEPLSSPDAGEHEPPLHYFYDPSSYNRYMRDEIIAFLSLDDVIRCVITPPRPGYTSLLLMCDKEMERTLHLRLPVSVYTTILHIDTFLAAFVNLFQSQTPALRLIQPRHADPLLRKAISTVHHGEPPATFQQVRYGIHLLKSQALQRKQFINKPLSGYNRHALTFIWAVHEEYRGLLRAQGCYEQDDLPLLALERLQQAPMQNTRYDQIIVCKAERCTVAQSDVIMRLLR